MLRKSGLLFVLLLFAYSFTEAQTSTPSISPSPTPSRSSLPMVILPPPEYEKQCGNPIYESMMWAEIDGKVTKIISGSAFIITLQNGEQRHVDLAAVDVPAREGVFGKVAFNTLTDLALNKDASVSVDFSNRNSKSIIGIVSVGIKDINRTMIELGIARYKEPPPYSMSNYTACVYRIVEGEARKAKRGLWQSVSP